LIERFEPLEFEAGAKAKACPCASGQISTFDHEHFPIGRSRRRRQGHREQHCGSEIADEVLGLLATDIKAAKPGRQAKKA
jgi:hypothetical protein